MPSTPLPDPPVATDAPGDQQPEPPTARAHRALPFWANQRCGLLAVIAVLIVVFSSLRPTFLNTDLSIEPMESDLSVLVVVGLAQLAVLSLGHMNLAIPRMAAISAFAMGWCYEHLHLALWPGMLVGLVVGAAVGALAGWIIVVTRANSFVVTLAMDFALLGLVTLLYSHVGDGVAFSVNPAGMASLGSGTFSEYCAGSVCGPPVPLIAPVALAALVVVALVFRVSRPGREILMTGSSLRAARLSGIPTSRRIIQAHALSGMLAALAGFLLAVNSGAFSSDIGSSFLLPSFLTPVLGGTLLSGGLVSVLGTLLGAVLYEVIRTGLNLLNFSVQALNVYIGLVLLGALSLDRVRHTVAERRGGRS